MTPQDWARLAKENDRPDADGIFLSCTNTRQIEAIADIEKMLGKPVVNSNQAVLWGAVKRLRAKVGAVKPMPQLGRLMASLNAKDGPHPEEPAEAAAGVSKDGLQANVSPSFETRLAAAPQDEAENAIGR